MNGTMAVLYRDYRQRMTNISLVFWDVLAPVAYLIIFGTGFESMIKIMPVFGNQSVTYPEFLLPGVLGMVTFGIAVNTSWGFFTDKDSGIVFEMLTYPITRYQMILGKICFNLLLAAVGSALVVLLGTIAFHASIRWLGMPLVGLITLVSTAAWFSILTGLAIRSKRMDTYNAIASAMYLLLMFFSSMFYPLNDVPYWFRAISYLNPLTWQIDLLRYAISDIGDGFMATLDGVALCVFTAVCLVFATRSFDQID
jgi:ABC-2 type transport system permease protein